MITELCEPVTLYQDRYIPVPGTLTTPVEIPELPDNANTLELGAAYKARGVRLRQANGQLTAIGNLNEPR